MFSYFCEMTQNPCFQHKHIFITINVEIKAIQVYKVVQIICICLSIESFYCSDIRMIGLWDKHPQHQIQVWTSTHIVYLVRSQCSNCAMSQLQFNHIYNSNTKNSCTTIFNCDCFYINNISHTNFKRLHKSTNVFLFVPLVTPPCVCRHISIQF
jgi:hypothetical protein